MALICVWIEKGDRAPFVIIKMVSCKKCLTLFRPSSYKDHFLLVQIVVFTLISRTLLFMYFSELYVDYSILLILQYILY